MVYYKMPDWSGALRNLYWFLRYKRRWDSAARRRYYRKIRVERDRLVSSGVDPEWVRLFCRWQSNLGGAALVRLRSFEARFNRDGSDICRRKPILPFAVVAARNACALRGGYGETGLDLG